MCNPACLHFGLQQLTESEISGRTIIEVGSRDVNGSLRSAMLRMGPASYLGTDIEMGPGVDELCEITSLADRYGTDRFDVVISTEVMEHVREWRAAISNLKRILKPGGTLLLTTRSRGFPYHGYPYDFWRYEIDDIRTMFSDMQVEVVESDPVSPGVFVKARKPMQFEERELESIQLYSIVTHRRSHDVTTPQVYLRRIRHKVRRALSHVVPKRLLASIDRAVTGSP
jgi:SAM-dependent methyltransferase